MCSISQRTTKLQNTTQLHNFHTLLWWSLCCGFPPKSIMCQDDLLKVFFTQLQDPFFSSHFIFLFAFKDITQHWVTLLIAHITDKLYIKYKDQNAEIVLLCKFRLFCQYTFTSSHRLIDKRASRILYYLKEYCRSLFSKDINTFLSRINK